MINRPKLLADLKIQVRDLESDLRSRFATHAEYKRRLTADWEAARDAGRTSEALETWAEAQFTQSAVAWVLACVFVRFCEDNDLLDAPLIAGTDVIDTSGAYIPGHGTPTVVLLGQNRPPVNPSVRAVLSASRMTVPKSVSSRWRWSAPSKSQSESTAWPPNGQHAYR